MSSKKDPSQRVEASLVLMASLAMTLWYAKGQFLLTLYFGYQVARVLFPQWLPPAGSSGG